MYSLWKELNKITSDTLKSKSLTYGDRFIWRPISHLILCPYISMGFRNPNIITIISIIFLFIGFFSSQFWLIYFMIWAVLDCADGSLARYNKKHNLFYQDGELIDAIGGYSFITIFWSKLYIESNNAFCIFTLIANLLARVIYLKYNNCLKYDHKSSSFNRTNKLYFIYENIEFGSFMLIIFMIFNCINFINIFILMYFTLSLLLLFYSLFKSFKNSFKPISNNE